MRIFNLIRQYFLENIWINYFRKVFHFGWLSSRLFFMKSKQLIIRPFNILFKRWCTWRRIFFLNLITLRINHKLRFNGLLSTPYFLFKLLMIFMSMIIIILLLLLLLSKLRMNKFLNSQLITFNNSHITQGWLFIRVISLLLFFHQVTKHLFSFALTYVYNLIIRNAFWIW